MDAQDLVVALLAGLAQGVFEWLPISSEGNVSLLLSLVVGLSPDDAVRLSLFLHAGTAVAATAYYRVDLRDALVGLPDWRPTGAFDAERAELSFLAVGTLVSGAVGVAGYALLVEAASALTGGAFVALVGLLLVATGVFQRVADVAVGGRTRPTAVDAVLVGVLQGLAVLPGVSRSGSTVGALLVRGYEGPTAFRLSFLLSVPAALGAGLLTVLDAGGLPGVTPAVALVALATSAAVGYLTIDALMRVVDRVAFWAVCVGLGALALLGGVLVMV